MADERVDVDEIKRGIRSLMVAENGGDMHDVADILREAVGLPRLEGNYLDGWTDADYEGLEAHDD